MNPIFIYNNNLIFYENQRFIFNFSDGDVLKGVNLKENDYYIMNMSCFIEVLNNITKLKQYGDIEKKKSVIANHYITNGIDYGFDRPEREIILDNKTYQFEINKIRRSKAVNVYNFYEHLLKRKRFAMVYSPYRDFVENGMTYEKKNKSDDIGGFTIKIIRKNNKDNIQKEIYFNKSRRLVSKIKKKKTINI